MRYLLLIRTDEDHFATSTSEEMAAVLADDRAYSDAEAREQLGGYYEVECDTLDQAIDAARRIPGAPPRRRGGAADLGDALTGVAHDAVARAFRDGYGRAVARLARALGDIDRAEDALQEAAAIALER